MALTGSRKELLRVRKPLKSSFRTQTIECVPTGTKHAGLAALRPPRARRVSGPSHPTRGGKADLLHGELAVHSASAPRALPGTLSAGHRRAGPGGYQGHGDAKHGACSEGESRGPAGRTHAEGKSRLRCLLELSRRNRRFPAVLLAVATPRNWERVLEKHFREYWP